MISGLARFFNQSSNDAQPTPVDTATDNIMTSSVDQSLTPSANIVAGMAGMPTGMVEDYGTDYGSSTNEVFDPLNWMLDGIVDFPYNFSSVNPLDPNQTGIGVMGTQGL